MTDLPKPKYGPDGRPIEKPILKSSNWPFFIAIGIVALVVLPLYFSGTFPFWVLFLIPFVFIKGFGQMPKIKGGFDYLDEQFKNLDKELDKPLTDDEVEDFIKENKAEIKQ